MKQSSELTFIDSSSNMEELSLRVFLVCPHSVAGALPLGIMIVSDERTTTLVEGFTLLKNCMGNDAFFGRKCLGPRVIMTDNCSELRDALKIVWPQSRLLLCIFHLMQQVWRWLCEKKNGVHADHRAQILSLMKSIIYAEMEDISERTDDMLEHSLFKKYPNAKKYLQDVLDLKESWALAYRNSLPIRGNNTNNYVEAQFLIIKDEILNRVKEYNIVGLVDKLTINLEEHYMTKLLSIADGSFDGIYSARFKGLIKNLPPSDVLDGISKNVVSVGNEIFKVPSFTCLNVEYLVDMSLSQCECAIGINGAPCKHQYLLWLKHWSTMSRNFLPIFNGKERQEFAKLAVGVSEGIRDRITTVHPAADQSNTEPVQGMWDEIIHHNVQETENVGGQSTNVEACEAKKCEAEKALNEAFSIIKQKLETGPNFVSAILKFSERVRGMSDQRLASALYCFNSDSTRSALRVSRATRQARQNKIKVQPEAVRRRMTKNGSRQRQSKGNSQEFRSVILNQSQVRNKRLHNFVHNVANNEPVAKKAGRSMMSVTKTGRKRVEKNVQG